MSITVGNDAMRTAWRRVAGIPDTRSPLEDNHYIYLYTPKKGSLAIVAQNGVCYAHTTCECSGEMLEGQIALAAHKANQLMENAEHAITFQATKNSVKITSGAWHIAIPNVAGVQAHRPPISNKEGEFIFSAPDVVAGITSVQRCISKAAAIKGYAADCVAIDLTNEEEPAVTAMSGAAMAVAAIEPKHSPLAGPRCLLAQSAATHARAFFSDTNGVMHLGVNKEENWLVMRSVSGALAIRLTSGEFPYWRAILNKNFAPADPCVHIVRSDFNKAIRKASFSVDPTADSSAMDLQIQGEDVSITAVSSSFGESLAKVLCENEEEYEGKLCMSFLWLQKVMQSIPTDRVTMQWNSENGCALFFGNGHQWMVAGIGD